MRYSNYRKKGRKNAIFHLHFIIKQSVHIASSIFKTYPESDHFLPPVLYTTLVHAVSPLTLKTIIASYTGPASVLSNTLTSLSSSPTSIQPLQATRIILSKQTSFYITSLPKTLNYLPSFLRKI